MARTGNCGIGGQQHKAQQQQNDKQNLVVSILSGILKQ